MNVYEQNNSIDLEKRHLSYSTKIWISTLAWSTRRQWINCSPTLRYFAMLQTRTKAILTILVFQAHSRAWYQLRGQRETPSY
ncbi:hypothetical protein ARMGADRAFT_177246 [Armillaria gallica]|uniref:Uncharacterized protein n=1 Tax=Armillaria gallica TaxID=47427 RepID=A0A2H3DA12_ARMGA|nr:hypothetical protein ARMGADRAFT_177246 [Armillaria gallica]